MKRSITILSRIEDGKLRRNRQLVCDAIKHFEGKEIEITIKRKYKQRSLPQNAFYHGVIVPFFQNLLKEHWGEIYSNNFVHEILKSACNNKEVVNPATGEVVKIPQSTTELTTAGWMEYEQKMEQLAMDFFGETLPKPNEQVKFNY